MKIRTDLFLIVIVLLFAACTSTRQATQPAPVADEKKPLVIPPPNASYTPEQLTSYYYLQGVRAAGIYADYPVAMASFRTALVYDSLHAPSYHELASLFFPTDIDQALAHSLQANQLDPENIWYKQQLGCIYIVSGQYDPARKVYDEIVKLDPNNPENYRYLAALYEQTGYPYAALTLLDSAELRFGFIEELSSYKRQLLIQSGMIDQAVGEAELLTQNSPYDYENFVVLGGLYAATGKDSLAVQAYRQALSVEPDNIEALMSLSDYYHTRNDGVNFLAVTKQLFESDILPLENKVTFFNDVIKNAQFYQNYYFAVNDLVAALAIKYAGNYEVAELYAQHQINSGDVEGAVATYKSALNENSTLEHYKTIIEIEAYLERNDSVGYYTDLALEKYSGEIDLYFTKGYGEYHMKAYDQSIATFNEALRHAPTDSLRSVIYSSMGQISKDQDSLSTAYARYFEQALKYDPENLHAVYNYSEYLIQNGRDPERALKNLKNDSLRSVMLGTIGDMFHSPDTGADNRETYRFYDKALKYNPDNIHVLNNYSYFLSVEERELEKALAMISRVLELEPGNPTYIDTYGWILYKLERYEEAKKALQQAVALDREGSKELLVHYGDILYELEDYFLASIYWKRAQENGYDPEQIEERLKKIEGK